jgi:predicted membrane protein
MSSMRLGLALRIAAGVAGVAMFVVAARYAAMRSVDVRPVLWVRWWVTAAVVHDVVVAPAAVAIGWLVVRFSPRAAKAPLQAGLIVTAVLVAVSWPALRGYGRIASNPTYLPRHYGTGLALCLAMVWASCAAWAVGRLVHDRRARHSG